MKANDLPPELFEIHRSVNAGLNLWGVSANDEASVEDLEWCKNTYPHWEQSVILPFICAKTKEFHIDLGTEERPNEGYISSFDELKYSSDYGDELSINLKRSGLILFLTNTGGDYLLIDSTSGMEMKICCIDFDDVANDRCDDSVVVRTRWTLRDLYQEIFRHPDWLRVRLFKEKKSRS